MDLAPMVRMVTEAMFSSLSSIYSFVFGVESSKVNKPPVFGDVSSPLGVSFVPSHSGATTKASLLQAHVLPVFHQTDIAQILPSVIVSFVVYMVDFVLRPFARLHAPNDAVSEKCFPKYENPPVAVSHRAPGRFICVFGVPYRSLRDRPTFGMVTKPLLTADLPEKFSGVGIVLKQFIHDRAIKLGLSHLDLHNRSSWSGRVQVLVTPPRPLFIPHSSTIFNSNLTCREI